MVLRHGRSAGMGIAWAINGTGGAVYDANAGIDLAGGKAIHGAGGTSSVVGTYMDWGT